MQDCADSISTIADMSARGQLSQSHAMGPFKNANLSAEAREFTIAAFLIGAGNLSYFTYANWATDCWELTGARARARVCVCVFVCVHVFHWLIAHTMIFLAVANLISRAATHATRCRSVSDGAFSIAPRTSTTHGPTVPAHLRQRFFLLFFCALQARSGGQSMTFHWASQQRHPTQKCQGPYGNTRETFHLEHLCT